MNYKEIQNENYIEKFINKYVDKDLLKSRLLLWNSLKVKTILFNYDFLNKIKLAIKDTCLLFDERERKTYKIKYKEFIDYILNLEPWEEVDYIIFDENIEWFIAITHEEKLLIYDERLNGNLITSG